MRRLSHLGWIILLLLLLIFIPTKLSRADEVKINSHFVQIHKVPSNVGHPSQQNLTPSQISASHIQNNYSPPPHATISNTDTNTVQQNQHFSTSQAWINNSYHDRDADWDHDRDHHYYHQTVIYVPYYYFNYYPDAAVNQASPDQLWISASDGYVPNNAIVYQTISGNPIYYCRVYHQDNFIVGILLPNDGCYIEINSENIGFENYQVLISNN